MGQLEVHIVPNKKYKEDDFKSFRAFFKNRFKPDMKINIKTRKKLKRTTNGIFLLLRRSIK